MREMTIRFLLALLLLAGGFTLGAGRFSGKLPGRIIVAKQLPDPVRRFVLQHFPSLNRFSYRWDKRFYYAVNENGGYLLLSADGMLGGFRYHVRQIPREFVDLLPGTSMTYLRERYPNHAFRSGRPHRVFRFRGPFCERGVIVCAPLSSRSAAPCRGSGKVCVFATYCPPLAESVFSSFFDFRSCDR